MSGLNAHDQHVNEERRATTTASTTTTTTTSTITATCPILQRPRSPSQSSSSSSSSSSNNNNNNSRSSDISSSSSCLSSIFAHVSDSAVASETENEEVRIYPVPDDDGDGDHSGNGGGSASDGSGAEYNVRTRFRENSTTTKVNAKPTRLQSLIKWHRRVVMVGTLTLYTLILLECIYDLGSFMAMALLIGIAIRVNLWPPDFHAMFLRIRESLCFSSLIAANQPDLTDTTATCTSANTSTTETSTTAATTTTTTTTTTTNGNTSVSSANAGVSAAQRQAFNNDAMILSNLILFVMRQAICPTRPYLYSLSLALNAFNTVMRHPTLNTPVLVSMVVFPSAIVAWDAYRDMDLLASIAALQVLLFVGFMLIGGTLSLMTALKRASSVSRRLEDALRAKSKLIAWTSHELRSPIFAIQGSLELLRRTRELSPEQLEHLRAIECSNTMVMTLVEDVLAYAKAEHEAHSSMRPDRSLIDILELYDSMNWMKNDGLRVFLDGNGDDDDDDIGVYDAGDDNSRASSSGIMSHGPENLVNLAWFSLSDCIDTVMSIGRGYSRSLNVRLELHYSPAISIFSRQIMAKGDSVKIQQCLVNLISNAIKFSPEGSTVILEIDLVDSVAIDIDRIAEDRKKFYRASDSGRRFNDSSSSSSSGDANNTSNNNNNNSNETHSGGRGHMGFSLDTIGGKRTLEFRVVDYGTGINIDRDKRDRIFLPFAQLNIQQSKIPSSGLGLGICKQLAKAMHGTIDFYSETEGENRGTTFVLRLPVSLKTISMSSENDHTSPSSAHSEELSTSHSCSSSDDLSSTIDEESDQSLPEIILAEDNPVVQRVILRLLNDCGIRAAAVSNGQLLIDALDFRNASSLEQFRVVILDKNMPIVNGIQCARLVRQRYPSVYIVMVTGDTVSEEDRALMDHVLPKPVTGTQICTTIRELIT